MSVSKSPGSYADCYAVMDAAITDPLGVRLRMANEDAATFFRMRCHMARKIDRDNNTLTFDPGDPLYAISIYDKLVLRIRMDDEDQAWLYLEQNTIIPGVAESLTTGEVVDMSLPVGIPPSRQLAAPEQDLGAEFDGIEAVEEPGVEILPPTQKVRRL